jgi:hypothetical protein
MMRAAFVLRLAAETEPSKRHFEGWIEEVDTGEELRFRSTDELLSFLGQRFQVTRQCRSKPEEGDENVRNDG